MTGGTNIAFTLGTVAVLVALWALFKIALWIGRIPTRRQQRREWDTACSDDRRQFEFAILHFKEEIDRL